MNEPFYPAQSLATSRACLAVLEAPQAALGLLSTPIVDAFKSHPHTNPVPMEHALYG